MHRRILDILSNIISKDVLEYVIADYANKLRNLLFHKKLDSIEKIKKLIIPVLINKHKIPKNNIYYVRIFIKNINDNYCIICCTGVKIKPILIAYDYIAKCIVNDIVFSGRYQPYSNRGTFYKNIYLHFDELNEIFKWNILTNESKLISVQTLGEGYKIKTRFYNNLIFIEHKTTFCHNCMLYNACSKKGINEVHNDWYIVDIMTDTIRQTSYNCDKLKYNANAYISVNDKYILYLSNKAIILHNHINGKNYEYALNSSLENNGIYIRIKNKKFEMAPVNIYCGYFIHKDLLYCEQYNSTTKLRKLKIYKLPTLEYIYSIVLKHPVAIFNDFVYIENTNQIYKIKDISKRHLNKN